MKPIDPCGISLMIFSAVFILMFLVGMMVWTYRGARNITLSREENLTGRNIGLWLILLVWNGAFVSMLSAEWIYFVKEHNHISSELCFISTLRKILLLLGIAGGVLYAVFEYKFQFLSLIEKLIHRRFRKKYIAP